MIPKIIWSYWDNPNIPDFISKVTNTWNKFCKEENDWKIMILNKNTINQFLDKELDYPSSIWSYIPQHQSDMFGVSLVKKYGGIWMDANIIMTGDIDFILDNVISNKDYLMIKGSNATGLNSISKKMIKGLNVI